jgi:flavin reductase (DIM6/NTAB) family NADH-FMN oxidoreductase RutF
MSFDSKQLRSAFGQFATGVCIATTTSNDGKPFGMTINSFSSVSLSPALVLWSVQNDSAQTSQWLACSHYGISVLAEDQQDISNYFATPGDRHISAEQLQMGAENVPLISAAKAQFECRVKERIDAGDHTILLAEVVAMHTPRPDAAPLLFFGGKYQQLSTAD